ncbi:vacuolar ATPase [Zalerion maritima]|uniref:V-type proton ATPase subunit G n=1 Tax=Zalerion maritima TaxID=339359 RepID=A0AAD5RRV0_9PEZI|nr:vacuolar ATPase [Zalerion maritima]
MSQKTQGIQQLLEAERKAAEIVQSARDYRTTQLRAARDDAKKLIEDKKKEAEGKYNSYANQNSSGSKSAEQQAEKDVEDRVKAMTAALAKGKDPVIKDLLAAVVTVE